MKSTTRLFGSLLTLAILCGCTPNSPSLPISSATTTSNPVRAAVADEPTAEDSSSASDPEQAESDSEQQASAAQKQEIERINFEDLNCNIQANLVFREWMLTPRAKELDGQRVRLAGYMLADLRTEGIEEFVLLKNNECKFGPDGQADHLAMIVLDAGETAKFTDKAVDVIGTLHYKPFQGIDGNTWAIYEIEAEAVRPMRR
jgi:hypothetical protein